MFIPKNIFHFNITKQPVDLEFNRSYITIQHIPAMYDSGRYKELDEKIVYYYYLAIINDAKFTTCIFEQNPKNHLAKTSSFSPVVAQVTIIFPVTEVIESSTRYFKIRFGLKSYFKGDLEHLDHARILSLEELSSAEFIATVPDIPLHEE